MGTSTRAGAKKAGGKKLTKEQLTTEVARATGAGKPATVETVDFSDPNRPKVCLEVDFPLVFVNHIAALEAASGALKKPVYQISKWWARRQSSVFRTLLLSAATKAPREAAEAARLIRDSYYHNHQKKGALKHLRVADIFMGGGTTVVEGSRLGMQMLGSDLNPVAWFVVRNELADVGREEVEALLADVESDLKPRLMPFLSCACPRGHRGEWTHIASGRKMEATFCPSSLPYDQRSEYAYHGPELLYVFWSKHGPCNVTGCRHCTPVMSSPVFAKKKLSVAYHENVACGSCGKTCDVELTDARIAPGAMYVCTDELPAFATLDSRGGFTCPYCGDYERFPRLDGKPRKRNVELSVAVHPDWLNGAPQPNPHATQDAGAGGDFSTLVTWLADRATSTRLIEIRGPVPSVLRDPASGRELPMSSGSVSGRGSFACGACGTSQRFAGSVEITGAPAPQAPYALQGYCPMCERAGAVYGGRYYAAADNAESLAHALREWNTRKDDDLMGWWPTSEIPFGHTTNQRDPLHQHGYSHWWMMFNPRQLLIHAQLLRTIVTTGGSRHRWETRELTLGAFQKYLRYNTTFSFWNIQNSQIAAFFSNNNYNPKMNTLETSVFAPVGDGSWRSAASVLLDAMTWSREPWELVPSELATQAVSDSTVMSGSTIKVPTRDPVADAELVCSSATDLDAWSDASIDLVITDPPFGDNIQYAELSDFFYVWLRLVLKERYPDYFGSDYTPKTLEAVANRARQPDDPDAAYKRLLRSSWSEAYRLLKPGGVLAFTFHHSADEPWVAVLESLFEAGFYLEATYPVRSDETKGEGQFGSQKIEYDIIHVCRKRTEEPTSVSWARMRRRVLEDVRQLQTVLENHAVAGLPEADLKVIKRGKALEYYSRHYGKVYVDEGRPFSVRDALIGINQLLDEEAGAVKEPPPGHAEPFTRQFLSLFRGVTELPRDQVQKDLRGTGYSPAELVERGWCTEERKTFYVKEPRALAGEWYRRHRRNLTGDYDQTVFLIGAASDGSGINIRETLANENFRPHPALKALLDWHTRHAATKEGRAAAQRALAIYATWEQEHPATAAQLTFFAE